MNPFRPIFNTILSKKSFKRNSKLISEKLGHICELIPQGGDSGKLLAGNMTRLLESTSKIDYPPGNVSAVYLNDALAIKLLDNIESRLLAKKLVCVRMLSKILKLHILEARNYGRVVYSENDIGSYITLSDMMQMLYDESLEIDEIKNCMKELLESAKHLTYEDPRINLINSKYSDFEYIMERHTERSRQLAGCYNQFVRRMNGSKVGAFAEYEDGGNDFHDTGKTRREIERVIVLSGEGEGLPGYMTVPPDAKDPSALETQ